MHPSAKPLYMAHMAEHLWDSVAQAEIDLDGEFTMEELDEPLEKAQFGKACGSNETRNIQVRWNHIATTPPEGVQLPLRY